MENLMIQSSEAAPFLMKPIAIDMTICLSNRTAVYSIATELFDLLPAGSPTRYWRFYFHSPPTFMDSRRMDRFSRMVHRFCSRDFDHLRFIPWPRKPGRRMLFVDPIFCSATPLHCDDLIYIHDLGPITHPDLYNPGASASYEQAYRRIQSAAPRLVFVSEYTRREYMKLYPADYRSNDVVPLYFRSMFKSAGDGGTGSSSDRSRTVLMVGGVERRKNHVRSIKAFWQSGLPEQGYKLKITGPGDNCMNEVLELIAGKPSVEYLGFVDAQTLTQLYLESEALLFPSLLEGFGMPALEAPRLGSIPIVSSNTVLEEIVGPDGIQVDPYSVESIAGGLAELAQLSSAQREDRIKSISTFQKKFNIDHFRESWRNLIAS
jgi:glycosyltransferase involved in cell wall biosynthesis